MKELKELRIDSGVIILDGHRVVSPIIPRSYKDIDNDIIVKGEAFIDGAVYARKFEIEKGPATVCGAIYTNVSLSSNPQNKEMMYFHKAVASSERIELYDQGRKYFGADVNGRHVTLKNAVVAANVFASEITLENCVVLGGAFAGKSLKITNSVVGTFNSPFASIFGSVFMLYPSVFTVEPLKVADDATLTNLTLADLGNLMLGKPEDTRSGAVQLNPEHDFQTASLEDSTRWMSYSVAGKVLAADMLDMRKLRNHFILSTGSLYEQLLKTYDLGQTADGKNMELSLESIGDFFMRILSGEIKVKAIDGSISFEELKEHFSEDA